MNITLDALDFAKLVAGQVVQKGGTQIILSDVGFAFMREVIDAAEHTGKTHPENERLLEREEAPKGGGEN